MKAAAYMRVSTEEQAESGTSLDTQAQRTRAYAEAQGFDLVEYVDAGVSGAKHSRPELDRLLAGVRSGEIGTVIVTRLDRLGRSTRHLLEVVEEFNSHDVQFVSLSEAIDTRTPAGRLFLTVLGAVAEFEHALIRERMTTGRRRVAEMGFYSGGRLPYGFRTVDAGNGRKRLEVNPEEARVLELAAQTLVEDRGTLAQVANHLNALGHAPRQAKKWNATLIRSSLSRDSLVEASIFTEARHEEITRALDARAQSHAPDSPYSLTGRLISTCGAPFVGTFRKDTNTRYYVCRGEGCGCPAIRADEIERHVWDNVCAVLDDPDTLLEAAEEYLGLGDDAPTPIATRSPEEIKQEVAHLSARISDLLADTSRPYEDVQRAVSTLEGERNALQSHLGMVESWQKSARDKTRRRTRIVRLAQASFRLLATMRPDKSRDFFTDIDLRVTVVEHAKRKSVVGKGVVVIEPTRVRIEGVLSDAREMTAVETPRGSALAREAAARPRGSRARR